MGPRRGLYSYSALQSRLAEDSYAANGLVDYTGPVIRLAILSPEDFYVLLTKRRNVQAGETRRTEIETLLRVLRSVSSFGASEAWTGALGCESDHLPVLSSS
jgi:hypothetical protein